MNNNLEPPTSNIKLLIITQTIDEQDDLLGFFIGWIRGFSKKAEQIYIICLNKGEYNLPNNVKVFSLGRERGVSRIGRWINFIKLAIKLTPKIDVIFSHMCPIYAVSIAPWAKLFGKKNTLWYAHGHVSFILRLSVWLSGIVFTSSLKGCRINNKKIKVVGQGIDVNKFKIQNHKFQINSKFKIQNSKIYKILSVGRISPSKGYEVLIKAIDVLVNQRGVIDLRVQIIGQPGLVSQQEYFQQLKELIKKKNLVNYFEFLGKIPNKDTVQYYQATDLFVNMSTTGSLDKTVFEAMSCALPVLTCNEAYEEILSAEYRYLAGDFMALADKIEKLRGSGSKPELREIVVKEHGSDQLIDKIFKFFKNG